jgi:hypothetical protein
MSSSTYLLESRQKGMTATMHNGPGYSGIRSDKLPVNASINQLVWTESRVSSMPRATALCLLPLSRRWEFTKDLSAILSGPAQPGQLIVFRDAIKSLSISGSPVQTKLAQTINLDAPVRLESADDYLDIEMASPFLAQGVRIYRIPEAPKNTFDGARDFPPTWTVLASNDSSTWTKVEGIALHVMDTPAVGTFAPVTAKYFKLQPGGPSWVTGIDLSGDLRLPNWAVKSALPAPHLQNPAIFPDVSSVIDPSSVIDVSKHINKEGKLS